MVPFLLKTGDVSESVRIFTEAGCCGLEEVLKGKKEGRFEEKELCFFLQENAESFDALKAKRIAVRDIRPANFSLFLNLKSEVSKFKIKDFSKALLIPEQLDMHSCPINSISGYDKEWSAPEVVGREEGFYNPFAADVYSFGLTVLYMMGLNGKEIEEARQKGSFDEAFEFIRKTADPSYSDFLCQMIAKMIIHDVKKRVSFKEISDMILINADTLYEIKPPDEHEFVEKMIEKINSFQFKTERLISFARFLFKHGEVAEAQECLHKFLISTEKRDSIYQLEAARLKSLIKSENKTIKDYKIASECFRYYEKSLMKFKSMRKGREYDGLSVKSEWRDFVNKLPEKPKRREFIGEILKLEKNIN